MKSLPAVIIGVIHQSGYDVYRRRHGNNAGDKSHNVVLPLPCFCRYAVPSGWACIVV
jgi:hypothetical protein